MIRAGIIGLGWWGKTLVQSVQGKSPKIQFTAAQTRSPEKAAEFCQGHGITLHDDLDSILSDPELDAIVSTTPHSEHENQVLKAAAYRKSVYIEKPFTLDRAGAERAVEAVRKAGVTLCVGFQRRFSSSHRDLKNRAQSGSLGTIVHCVAEVTAPGLLLMPGDSWRNDPKELLAGAMTPIGIHALDGMVDLLGQVDTVYCSNLKRLRGRVEDTTSVLLEFRSGPSASLLSSMVTARNSRMAVYGTRGLVEVIRTNKETLRFTPVPNSANSAGPPRQPESVEFPECNLEKESLEAFAEAITSGVRFPVPADELMHVVASFEAIVRSATNHTVVKVLG